MVIKGERSWYYIVIRHGILAIILALHALDIGCPTKFAKILSKASKEEGIYKLEA